MKIRRFIRKRRQRLNRKLADAMAAKHLGAGDRLMILEFKESLRAYGILSREYVEVQKELERRLA